MILSSRFSQAAELESRTLRSELRTERDALRAARAAAEEAQRAAAQAAQRGGGRRVGHDFDERLRQATDALLERQNALERAQGEVAALRLQLERRDSSRDNAVGREEVWRYESDQREEEEERFAKTSLAPMSGVLPRRLFAIGGRVDVIYAWLVSQAGRRPRARLIAFIYIILLHVVALAHI